MWPEWHAIGHLRYLATMVLYGTLALCALLAGLMVYRYDLHEREPWYTLVVAAVLGGAAMYGAGEVQVAVLTGMGNAAAQHWNLAISAAAGITEELAKFGVVAVIAVGWPRMFNDPMDGIVYGSLAGLGAALEESASLLGWSGRVWEFLPMQEPVRLLGHLVMGGIGGFGMGMIRPQLRRRWGLATGLTLGFAIVIHVVWDIVAFSAADRGRMEAWHKAAAVTIMLGGLALYWRLVALSEGLSREWFMGGDGEVVRDG